MKRILSLVAAAALVTGAGALTFAADKLVAGGYCPVAYAKMGQAVKGDPKIKSTVQGREYHFANAGAKKMFDANPAMFPVAFDGYCATGVAMGKKLESNPEIFVVRDGTTYLFSNAEAKAAFEKDPAMTIAKANEKWSTIQ